MREGVRYLQQNAVKLRIESSEDWYENMINRQEQCDNIQQKTNRVCSREDWGTHYTDRHHTYEQKHSTYAMYKPDRCPLSTIHNARQLQRLHDTFILRGTHHLYLMYDGYQYKPLQYGNATPQDKNFTMPIWIASPPTQRQKRIRTIISLDDSDSGSDNKNEDHNNDKKPT